MSKTVSLINEENLLKEMKLFEWKVVSTQYKNEKAIIEFERNTTLPYYRELVGMEKRILSLRELPLWPLFVMVFVSCMLITAILVLWIVLDAEFEMLKWLAILGLPAILISILASVYILWRAKKVEKLDIEKRKLKEEIAREIEEIRKKYGN